MASCDQIGLFSVNFYIIKIIVIVEKKSDSYRYNMKRIISLVILPYAPTALYSVHASKTFLCINMSF